jgi:hypothetical protein
VSDLHDFWERLWNGEVDTVFKSHPVTTPYNGRGAEELAEAMLYSKALAAATTIDTDDGLVMLDTGARNDPAPNVPLGRGRRL